MITFYTYYIFILYILIYICNYNIVRMICEKGKEDKPAGKHAPTRTHTHTLKRTMGKKFDPCPAHVRLASPKLVLRLYKSLSFVPTSISPFSFLSTYRKKFLILINKYIIFITLYNFYNFQNVFIWILCPI